jgi:hypothetical protein
MRIIITVVILLASAFLSHLAAQDRASLHSSSVTIHTAQRGLPSASLEYTITAANGQHQTQLHEESTPVPFTALAVAWSSNADGTQAHLHMRSRPPGGLWSDWQVLTTEAAPTETPSGLYWSSLATTPDGTAHTEFEIQIPDEFMPSGSSISVMLVDARNSRVEAFPEEPLRNRSTLDLHPTIVPRSGWWGDLPIAYLSPTNYTPEYISITHAIVHHTAGANNPPDPAQDIRSIWYYHVFGQGWSDIAYNFLIDHNGVVYQGRYNPYVDLLDVRGSHATYANTQSVGVSLLGTFSVDTPPSAAAVQSLTRVLAWRFEQKHLDPLSRADMVSDQAGHTVNLYRISGHRDVSATACPGDALYMQLPAIRATADLLIRSDDSATVPQEFFLAQNYPNPFNPATTIDYSLPEPGSVRLIVYDLLGRQVARLVDEHQSAGPHTAVFDATQHASGTYIYVLTEGSRISSRRMMMIR